MSPEALWKKFNELFGYLVPNTTKYSSIQNDTRSIRVFMKDGNRFIFTYPRNGHYTLVTESFREE